MKSSARSASMKPAPSPPHAPPLAEQRRTGRSAIVGLVILAVVSLATPLVSWRAEERLAREEITQRLWDQARLEAAALSLHLRLLVAELERIAATGRLSPQDGLDADEFALLSLSLGGSALFSEGVALLSPDGALLWSDPGRLLHDPRPARRPWFQKALETRQPLVDLLSNDGEERLVVVVPVVRLGEVAGLLVGAFSATTGPFPGSQALGEASVLLFDEDGRLLLSPADPGGGAPAQGALGLDAIQAHVRAPGVLQVGDSRLLVAAAPLDIAGLTLAVVEDEDRATQGLSGRFIGQLIFSSAVLLAALALFTFLLRRAYLALLEAEERLRRQETVAALGSASQLIAHEVKNALNGIQAALSALRGTPSAEDLPLAALRAQVVRLGNLARSLLSFGEPRLTKRRRSCELHLLVEEALQAVRLLPETGEVELTPSLERQLRVWADPALLVSAIDNLIRNAIEAAAVARDTGLRAEPWVRVTLSREGRGALLTVEDDAGGVDPTLEPRLWEPFATARAKGIGLGLPMARKAVEDHDGTLNFIRTSRGSRFELRLPLEEEREPTP